MDCHQSAPFAGKPPMLGQALLQKLYELHTRLRGNGRRDCRG